MTSLSICVGKRIKQIRESKGIKQVELAEMINIEPTNLSKIEKGVHLPKEDNINKITKALNIEIKDLFDFKHIKPRDELLDEINGILSNLKTEEIQFFYRILTSFKEIG